MNPPTYLPPKEAAGVVSVAVLPAHGVGLGSGVCIVGNGQKIVLNRYQAKALVTKLTVHLAKTPEVERRGIDSPDCQDCGEEIPCGCSSLDE